MVLFVSGLAACAGDGEPSKSNDDNFQRDEELERRLEARREAYKRLPEQLPDKSPTQIVGEVPESLLATIKQDLAGKLDISVDAIEVARAEAVTWNDGSLGCARPGEMYTQALVPGYRVILDHHGRQYDYRAAERGHFFLCELPTLMQPPADT